MRFGTQQLREKALAALEEAAQRSSAGPVERTKALGFALAFLWALGGGDRGPFTWFWQSLATPEEIGRAQNVHASLNAVYRAVGLVRG
jgi:hypothetical protein